MKNVKKIALFAAAVALVFVGFFFDRKNNVCSFAQKEQAMTGPIVNIKEPLTVHNETGSKVNAAFYNKRLKRRGAVIRVQGEKMELARTPLVPYLAVSRNAHELGEKITKSRPSRINIRRTKCVAIKSRGHDLVVTPTLSRHKH